MVRMTVTAMGMLALGAAGLAAPAARPKKPESKHVFELLQHEGGHLGVSLEDVASEDVARLKLAEERGAVVTDVAAGSAAEKAGLKEGDVILKYQGQEVQSAAQLRRLVRETPAGRKITIEVSRDGSSQRLAATLDQGGNGAWLTGDMFRNFDVPEPPVPPMPPGKDHALLREFFPDRGGRKLGLQYQEISGQLAKYFHLTDDHGILVVEVDDGGPAAKAGIKAGDVVVKVNGKAVQDGGDLHDELARLSSGDEAALTVLREGKSLELKVTLGGRRPASHRSGEPT